MRKLTLAQAMALRTPQKPIVVLSNNLVGIANEQSFNFSAWTNPSSSLFMSRWLGPDWRNPRVRYLKVPRSMALGALQKFINHIKRIAISAKCWRIDFRGSIQLLLPNGRIATIAVDSLGVNEDRVAKWWATRYNYKRVA